MSTTSSLPVRLHPFPVHTGGQPCPRTPAPKAAEGISVETREDTGAALIRIIQVSRSDRRHGRAHGRHRRERDRQGGEAPITAASRHVHVRDLAAASRSRPGQLRHATAPVVGAEGLWTCFPIHTALPCPRTTAPKPPEGICLETRKDTGAALIPSLIGSGDRIPVTRRGEIRGEGPGVRICTTPSHLQLLHVRRRRETAA